MVVVVEGGMEKAEGEAEREAEGEIPLIMFGLRAEAGEASASCLLLVNMI